MRYYGRLGLFGAVTLAAAACLAMATPPPSYAADKAFTGGPANLIFAGYVIPDLSTPYTNSTTSYTAVGGSGGVITAPDVTKYGDYSKSAWWVCYSVQASKATATTGTVGVAVDGTVNADTARTLSSSAGSSSLGGCFGIALPDGVTHAIKLMAKSGDTNAFTISGETLTVWRIRQAG